MTRMGCGICRCASIIGYNRPDLQRDYDEIRKDLISSSVSTWLQQTWFTKGLWRRDRAISVGIRPVTTDLIYKGIMTAAFFAMIMFSFRKCYNRPDLQRDYDSPFYPIIIIPFIYLLQQTWFTKGLWPINTLPRISTCLYPVTTDLIYKGIMTKTRTFRMSFLFSEVTTDLIYKGTSTSAP